MAAGGTLTVRITDLIGSEYTTNANYEGDLINAAINEIADMLPEDLLAKYSTIPAELTSNSGWLTEDKKVLQVTRIDADGVERTCKEVGRSEYTKASDSNSIYAATAYSPIYHESTSNDGAATLRIIPEPTGSQKGKIWYFSYATGDNSSISQTSVNTSLYMPSNVIHAIALKSCINILKAYISNQVQDEEDIEMMQMVQSQMQLLEKDFVSEMQRFKGEEETPPKGE